MRYWKIYALIFVGAVALANPGEIYMRMFHPRNETELWKAIVPGNSPAIVQHNAKILKRYADEHPGEDVAGMVQTHIALERAYAQTSISSTSSVAAPR